MKIFISWSGETSKQVGLALREWLPFMIQAVDPWMSEEDIESGARWFSVLSEQLDTSDFAICCLTPESLVSPWLHFEAGALARRVTAAHVCPYLFRLERADVKGPFSQFQSQRAAQEDTRKLLQTINDVLPKDRRSEGQLAKTFEKWWPDLEGHLASIPLGQAEQKPRRDLPEMVEEMLELVRGLARGQDEAARAAVEEYDAAIAQVVRQLNAATESLTARSMSPEVYATAAKVLAGRGQTSRWSNLQRILGGKTPEAHGIGGLGESSARKKEPTDSEE
jgi:TIR domain